MYTFSAMTLKYDRTNPFLAKLVLRERLNKTGSTKETWHVVIDLEGSGLTYRPGDSFGILPHNDPKLVDAILASCQWDGDLSVFDERSHSHFSLREWLLKKANLASCTRKFLLEIIMRLPEGEKKEELRKLTEAGNEDDLKKFIHSWNVPEVIALYPEAALHPNDLVTSLQPLLPRLYSIASAQSCEGNHVHFTVSRVRYDVAGRKRLGICSHFLCDMIEVGAPKVPVYLQSTRDFILPEDTSVPVIMIGPGTGVAPFRAFMQERVHRKVQPQKSWLFFGERHREHDFFYEEYWQQLVSLGLLRLDLAFSRDQEEKVYVQHKLWENREEVWRWIQDGAKIYVCGDAERMAKDVDNCLQQIVSEQAKISLDAAKAFLTGLRREKQYLRDVY
ncbi:MAG: sulfite reductase [Verrucomicrobia bacterium]|nr:sulfite reductase [Verrucomicrobiota bacterium]